MKRIVLAMLSATFILAGCTSTPIVKEASPLTITIVAATSTAHTIREATSVPTATTFTPTYTPVPSMTSAPTIAPVFSGVCTATNYCPLGDCHKNECLFISPAGAPYVSGLATIRGYYTIIGKTGFNNQHEQCDSFVIIGGSKDLILSYLALIEAGNGVNSKNELNQPIISLDFSQLDAQDKQQILSSTQSEPIDLLVVSPIAITGMGAPICYSPVEIVKAK